MAKLSHVAQQDNNDEPNIFRSEEMVYVQMYMQPDAAHATIEELGKRGLVQFVDKNPKLTAFQRPFANDVKRCDELQRKLRYLRGLLDVESIKVVDSASGDMTLADIEPHIDEIEQQLRGDTAGIEAMASSLSQKEESQLVLQTCEQLLSEMTNFSGRVETESTQRPLLEHDVEAARNDNFLRVKTICGVIPDDRAKALDRVLFRITRGNCIIRFADQVAHVMDSKLNKTTPKRVFAAFYSGERVGEKINKVVIAFGGAKYEFETNTARRTAIMEELNQTVDDMRNVLAQSRKARNEMLLTVSRSINRWDYVVESNKLVFHTMNKFEFDGKRAGMVGEGWCPKRMYNSVQHALQDGAARAGVTARTVCTTLDPPSSPPTYFRTNKLTSAFQLIVDAYGIGNYREMNPTPFTVITFPFLFAVMFGDLGHGFLMLLFAIYMIANEKHFLKNPPGEIFGICFGGRYVVLLMSIFSLYAGFLYNETFSVAMNIFDSPYSYHWIRGVNTTDGEFNPVTNLTDVFVVNKTDRTYPFGMDPVWKQADNELTFTNSLKMKMSVVFGVIQMSFGIMLSCLNHIHNRDMISLFNQFVPQILFLGCIFGYLVVLIFIKWANDYNNKTHCAPDILATLISLFIDMGAVPAAATDDDNCHSDALIDNQKSVQIALLLVAVLSIPWMLLGKPLLLKSKHKKYARLETAMKSKSGRSSVSPQAGEASASAAMVDTVAVAEDHSHGGHGGHGEEFDFGEEMVHNLIHTIEFVLGAVSNTASYLRLWALSLAHGQLSTVFWEKTLVSGFTAGSVGMCSAITFAAFFFWLMFTLGVLMVMESLSAFLHALRLHWVEFQNKFYAGGGVKFEPFVLKSKP